MQGAVLNASGDAAGEVLRAGQQLPLLPREVAPAGLKARFFRRLQRDIKRQKINFAVWPGGAPDFAERGRQLIGKRLQPGQTVQLKVARADAQLVAAGTVVPANVLRRDPRHRQRAARPRLAVNRDPRIGDTEAPALLIAGDVRRQVIHHQPMGLIIALPAGAAFFQPYVAAGDIAFVDSHPSLQG
nr:Uncharacterised protein [Raoultella sp. NCTC 9187]